MKKLLMKAGLLVASAVAMIGTSSPAQADQTGISGVSSTSPLYLDQTIAQTDSGNVVMYHYSHGSHGSHGSHESHYSHYSSRY